MLEGTEHPDARSFADNVVDFFAPWREDVRGNDAVDRFREDMEASNHPLAEALKRPAETLEESVDVMGLLLPLVLLNAVENL